MTRRYLVVDDNQAFAENCAEILRDTGAEVTVATEGASALALATASRFDALITDLRMPGLDGVSLARAIRQADPSVPIIVLSAFCDEANREAVERQGVLAVLSKPHSVPELLALLERARRGGVVAIVEDHEQLARHLAEAARGVGLSPVVVSSVDGVKALTVTPFAALVDLKVPGGAPGSALSAFRERFPGVPTLVISGMAGASALIGSAEIFEKPFSTAAVMARLDALYRARLQS